MATDDVDCVNTTVNAIEDPTLVQPVPFQYDRLPVPDMLRRVGLEPALALYVVVVPTRRHPPAWFSAKEPDCDGLAATWKPTLTRDDPSV